MRVFFGMENPNETRKVWFSILPCSPVQLFESRSPRVLLVDSTLKSLQVVNRDLEHAVLAPVLKVCMNRR